MKKKTDGVPKTETCVSPGTDAKLGRKQLEWGINFLVNSLKASYPKKVRDIERFAKLLKEQGKEHKAL